MNTEKHPTQFTGVRYRNHISRKHNRQLDRYFFIRYRANGKLKEEGIGWASEGWNATEASVVLGELKKNHLKGEGPQTLEEKRALEAENKEKALAEKELQEKENITFRQYFTESYFPIAKSNKGLRSYNREESLFRLWIEPVIGKMPFKDVRPFHMEKIKKVMTDAKKAPRSIHYALAVVRQVFNHAKRNEMWIGESPTAKVIKPKINNMRERFLSHREADMLLEDLCARSQNLHDMALLSLHCGLRAGEIFDLTWGCVDFENGTILLLDTKSGKNRRAYMTSDVRKVLERKGGGLPTELIFKDAKGEKIADVSNAFAKAVVDLGLNDGVTDSRLKVTFHSLRHTFASWLVMDGTDLYTVMKLLGHSTISMTERYSHLSSDSLRRAVQKLDMSLRGTQVEKVVHLNSVAQEATKA
jgi:integrase